MLVYSYPGCPAKWGLWKVVVTCAKSRTPVHHVTWQLLTWSPCSYPLERLPIETFIGGGSVKLLRRSTSINLVITTSQHIWPDFGWKRQFSWTGSMYDTFLFSLPSFSSLHGILLLACADFSSHFMCFFLLWPSLTLTLLAWVPDTARPGKGIQPIYFIRPLSSRILPQFQVHKFIHWPEAPNLSTRPDGERKAVSPGLVRIEFMFILFRSGDWQRSHYATNPKANVEQAINRPWLPLPPPNWDRQWFQIWAICLIPLSFKYVFEFILFLTGGRDSPHPSRSFRDISETVGDRPLKLTEIAWNVIWWIPWKKWYRCQRWNYGLVFRENALEN